ncbi:MAG TPA: hypothetical protein VFI96_04750, partial [Longimicrobiaceae bacterium]|nr:hypothetical protein [Longimicrobiaceae bacterium]
IQLAGDFYGNAAPGEIREVAAKLGMAPTTWWRRTSGTEHTPLSRMGMETLRFRRADFGIGAFVAYLATVALLPDVERMTLQQLNERLIHAHSLEGAANAQLNHWQDRHLTAGEPVFYQMAQAAIDQRDKSELVARLALRLHLLAPHYE